MGLRLYDTLLRLRGFPTLAARPCAGTVLCDGSHARVRVWIYLLPAQQAWVALATVSVDFRGDAVSVEMEYDHGIFSIAPDPAALLRACVAGITRIWGGPEHFIRFGLLELNARLSPCERRN